MTRTHLIDQCRLGDRRAQLELYRELAPRLFATCVRIVGSRAEAEEAMQDAVLKLLRRLTEPEGEPIGAVAAGAPRIAVRPPIDCVRRRDKLLELTDDEAAIDDALGDDALADDPSAAIESEERIRAVRAALASLPTGYRTILSLHLFEEYDFKEIAELLALQPASVRSQYLRAKRKLLELLEPDSH
jgi:RNA polymerase sigma-70 factor (ECF subfamily)